MATSLKKIISEMLSAPASAMAEVEGKYREIWAEYLEKQSHQIIKLSKEEQNKVSWSAIVELHPVFILDQVMAMEGVYTVSSVNEVNAGGEVGISLSAVTASGSFGFANKTANESTMRVSTAVSIANSRYALKEYLAQYNLTVKDAGSVQKAILMLKGNSDKPLPVTVNG